MEELLSQIPNWAMYSMYIGTGTVAFRLLAEVFNKVSEMTDNKTDDKWAKKVSDASWAVAKFFALFGIRAGLAVPDHLKEDPKE